MSSYRNSYEITPTWGDDQAPVRLLVVTDITVFFPDREEDQPIRWTEEAISRIMRWSDLSSAYVGPWNRAIIAAPGMSPAEYANDSFHEAFEAYANAVNYTSGGCGIDLWVSHAGVLGYDHRYSDGACATEATITFYPAEFFETLQPFGALRPAWFAMLDDAFMGTAHYCGDFLEPSAIVPIAEHFAGGDIIVTDPGDDTVIIEEAVVVSATPDGDLAVSAFRVPLERMLAMA